MHHHAEGAVCGTLSGPASGPICLLDSVSCCPTH